MRGDDAYAVLGLWPGAGRAEIDQAYRRLIKRYHPDYAGGDANRAAEINRAYSLLRSVVRAAPPRPPPSAAMQPLPYPRSSSKSPALALGVAVVVAAAVLVWSAVPTDTRSWSRFATPDTESPFTDSPTVRASGASLSLDEPLATELIESSVDDAMRLHAGGDPAQAAQLSRDCLRRLGTNPSVQLFDSCAAYDEAIAILGVDNPAFESGAFNPSAVTARQVGAARLISADYFEAESRLQQIRSRVHLVLLPRIPYVRRAVEERMPVIPPSPRIAEAPAVRPAIPPRAETGPAGVRVSVARPAPQAVRRVSVQQRPAPQPRRALPPPARSATPPPPARSTQTRPVPEWQKPIKPTWQRPLAPAND
ncbi:MAG: DnaJ domain-containing protein [Pseudomonadota bacterium]|nr:DnaJ domain-containing protein [Sphingomonas sp.]MDQ3478965.1 DnaJ domain-containing protein [Pseudomonadota bacterium]